MSKRSGLEATPGSSPAKLPRLEPFEYPNLDDGDDDFTTAQTPSSLNEDPGTPTTTATTPRSKFPSDLKTLACTWPGCPKTFNRPARLRDHLNSHTNSRPFKCTYAGCDKDYIEDKHLKQHIKAVHTLERKHVCQREGCGKSFTTGTRLRRHQAVHEGADRFRCSDCGQSFRKKDTLSRHVRRDHLGKPEHQCHEAGCGMEFESKGALNRHRQREHGELKFWCTECEPEVLEDGTQRRVGFTTEALLQAHVKFQHQNCMFCEFKSTSQWEMERHVEMHHSGKTVQDRKTEACPYDGCEKRFTKKSNLNAHVRSAHEGVRFVCGEVALNTNTLGLQGWTNDQGCGDKFVTKARLEDHVRFVHLKHDRPKLSRADNPRNDDILDIISGVAGQPRQMIECPHCPRTFLRYADLNAHTTIEHDPTSADPASLLSQEQLSLDTEDPNLEEFGKAGSAFDFSTEEPPAWIEEFPEEEIFAAGMDYGQPADDWLEDEASIMILARNVDDEDVKVDPALTGT